MQNPEEFDSSPSSSTQKWHPKLTPYRLLVLGTTIGVGTAKAVAAQEGDQSVSTTLEWVSGVVIFLILYTMSTYDESPKDPPAFLGWLFRIDCMDYIWHFLSLLCISRPLYSSEPQSTPRLTGKDHAPVPVTLYRLFVCVTTVFFGLAKATITYFGDFDRANWVDWTLGVIVTAVLFILAMYENNTIGMWHGFFVPDHGTETQYGLTAVALVLIYLPFIATCFWMIYSFFNNQYALLLSNDENPVLLAHLTSLAALRENLLTACLILFLALVIVVSLFAGMASIAAVMNSSGLPKWKSLAGRMMGQGPAWNKGYMQLESPARGLGKKIGYHAVIFSTFLLGCAVYVAFWVVSIASNVEEGYTLLQSDSKPSPGYLAFLATIILYQLAGAGVAAFLMWLVARKVFLPPLWRYRGGDVHWDKELLF